jgi:hypothetical protein
MNNMRNDQSKTGTGTEIIEEDNLIDFQEFSSSVSVFKQKDYYKLLPRTLSF